MEGLRKVSLVSDGELLLGFVARERGVAGDVFWRPFAVNTDRTVTELGPTERRKQAEQAIRNAWGVEP